jgi:hypothetical protein
MGNKKKRSVELPDIRSSEEQLIEAVERRGS